MKAKLFGLDRRTKLSKATGATELLDPEDTSAGDSELLCTPLSVEEMEETSQMARMTGQRLPIVRTQASRFMNVLNELRSTSDRICNAADRETECAEETAQDKKTELATLRLQLKEESLKARGLALRELEEAWKAKLEQNENQLRRREVQLSIREGALARLTSKVYGVISRLNQTESESQRKAERLEAELTELRHQLKAKNEHVAAKQPLLEKLQAELKEKIKQLESRLQASEAKLLGCETELKQKETLIQAAAAKEAEIGKLIKSLSSECDKLSSELHQKSALIVQLEKRPRNPMADAATLKTTIVKKVLARIQEQPV
jgi:chromosome segregation ATPase